MNDSKINQLKALILKTAFQAQEGHIPSGMSILDILYVLYYEILRPSIDDYKNNFRDRFILSKGHGSLGLYVILADLGIISMSDLESFCNFRSRLGGHPDYLKIPGIEASTGSLGHGFPIAVGIALGNKIANTKKKTFVLIGDGESNEGSIWESAALSSHHNLTNLTCIVDYNHSTDRALNMGDLKFKFHSFGWECRIIDGHEHSQIFDAFTKENTKPTAIIAQTVKGKGLRDMENNPEWHHKALTKEMFDKFIEELE